MRRQLVPALRMLVVLTVLCGVVYPLVVTGIAQGLFEHKADGSLIVRNGTTVGSELLGQSFTRPGYFHPRPSAAGDGYDGSASSASNLGPTNPDLIASIEERVVAFRAENGLSADTAVPVDAVTASGSGLDPHISVANARLQVERVAATRGVAPEVIVGVLDDHTSGRGLGVLGERAVNVVQLNIALDSLAPPS